MGTWSTTHSTSSTSTAPCATVSYASSLLRTGSSPRALTVTRLPPLMPCSRVATISSLVPGCQADHVRPFQCHVDERRQRQSPLRRADVRRRPSATHPRVVPLCDRVSRGRVVPGSCPVVQSPHTLALFPRFDGVSRGRVVPGVSMSVSVEQMQRGCGACSRCWSTSFVGGSHFVLAGALPRVDVCVRAVPLVLVQQQPHRN